MKKFAIFILLSSPSFATFSGYTYQRTITIDHTKVGTGQASQSNFPVLISTNIPSISTAASYGHMNNAYDSIFSTNSDCSYKLHWDTETVNNTGTSTTTVWVNIPSVSSTTDTVFYWCYGNSSVTTYQGISTATWDSNYMYIYHLRDGQTLSANDSTVNALNGSISGPTATDGKMDGASNFSGQNGNWSITTPSNLNIPNTHFTIEAWTNPTSGDATGSYERVITNNYASGFYLGTDNGTGKWLWIVNGDFTLALGSISAGTWTNLIGVWDGTNSIFYINGSGTSHANGTPTISGTAGNKIGLEPGGGNGYFGKIDEIRVSSIARSADWITTQYNNQSSPGTFLSIGNESTGAITTQNNSLFFGEF